MSTTNMTHTLVRDNFSLSLTLDEDTGDFVCSCKPPLNDLINADVQRVSAQWFKQIAYGWALRRNHGRVDRKDVRIDSNGFFKRGSTMRGTFVAPEMTAQEVAAANTRAQLVAKLKRGEKLVGNEVKQAIEFGLGEPCRDSRGMIALKPYNCRTPNWARFVAHEKPPRLHRRRFDFVVGFNHQMLSGRSS
jgi:hypothetical protein